MRRAGPSVAVVACALLGGCGYVGEPLYPALNIPSRVTDLAAVERGDRIDVSFTIPPLTTEGLELREMGAVELRAGPNGAGPFQIDRWAAAAIRVDVPQPEHPGAVAAQIPAAGFAGQDLIVAVRAANAKGRMSEWSNVAVLPVQAPVPSPTGLTAEPVAQGVQLAWKARDAGAFRVYRRVENDAKPALLATAEKPEYLDASAEYGKSYEYYVQAVSGRAESDVAGPARVTPQDVFPPAAPSGVTAAAGIGAIELAWERNVEPGFKAYRVYRAPEGAGFSIIAGELEAPNYSDRAVEAGKRYRYRITAVGQNGAESPPSDVAEAAAP